MYALILLPPSRFSSTRPLQSSLTLLLFSCRSIWLVITMIKQCYRESYPLVLRDVWCPRDAGYESLLWSLSSASKTTFVVVLSQEVGEIFHRSTTKHRAVGVPDWLRQPTALWTSEYNSRSHIVRESNRADERLSLWPQIWNQLWVCAWNTSQIFR